MERKMRRFKQLLSVSDTKEILNNATNGVLSLLDSDGGVYGVPVSFAYDGCNHIYLHSAIEGHKIDCITADSRCSFCVIGQDWIIPEEFTSYFQSVIIKGSIHRVSASDELISL